MEQTIAKPLSGAEVRKAIVRDIERALELDDRFHAHIAYDGFSFKATIVVSLPSGVQQELTREISGGQPFNGLIQGNPESDAIIAERGVQAPNEVRYETEQPIPMLVEDPKGGTQEKWVSYKDKDKAGRPLGHKPTPDSPPTSPKVKRNVVQGV